MDKAEELFGPIEPVEPAQEVQQEVTPEPAIEPTPEAPQPPQPEPQPAPQEHTVPLAKYLDTRDELKELKRYKAEQEAKLQQQQAPKAPDPIDDPDGFAAYQDRRFQQQLAAQKFEMSDTLAKQTHGDEVVKNATEWALKKAESDPVFASQYMREPHPIDWMVRQHQRDSFVSQLPTDVSSLDELIEREIAKRGLSAPPAASAPAPAATVQPVAAPTPSLVNQPSSGGIATVAGGATSALETVFPR